MVSCGRMCNYFLVEITWYFIVDVKKIFIFIFVNQHRIPLVHRLALGTNGSNGMPGPSLTVVRAGPIIRPRTADELALAEVCQFGACHQVRLARRVGMHPPWLRPGIAKVITESQDGLYRRWPNLGGHHQGLAFRHIDQIRHLGIAVIPLSANQVELRGKGKPPSRAVQPYHPVFLPTPVLPRRVPRINLRVYLAGQGGISFHAAAACHGLGRQAARDCNGSHN